MELRFVDSYMSRGFTKDRKEWSVISKGNGISFSESNCIASFGTRHDDGMDSV